MEKKKKVRKPQHIDKDVADVGARVHAQIVEQPVDTKMEDGRIQTVMQALPKKERLAQPLLTEEEAIGFGKLTWHRYTGPVQPDRDGKRPELFTTVVNGRRFMVTAKIFAALKNGKMAERDG